MDLVNSFKSMKGVAKVITMKNDPVTLMSARVNKAIDNDARINLKKSNKKFYVIFVDVPLKL